MDKTVLAFIEKLEVCKSKIKSLHWDSNSLSQHELCDDIAERIAEFQDQVSEVEQSISGKLPRNMFKPANQEYGEVGSLKEFVESVIEYTNTFYKELEKKGDKYIGMRSDCESFLSDMQRKLYLVNFTIKEELKNRLRAKINESRPKNLAKSEDVEKFIGRRPKSIKARISRIYRIVKKYGIDSRKYDDVSSAIEDYDRAITSLGCEVEMKPCADMNHAGSLKSDGEYDEYDNMSRSKQYSVRILFDDGMTIDGYIKCMASGTASDPFSSYDTCMILWPKSNKILESKNMRKQIKLTEAEFKQIIKESTLRVLAETELNYDVDNFSGRETKWSNGSDLISGKEYYSDDGGYLDNPFDRNEISDAIKDDEWEWGKDMDLKGAENDYSWDRFENKPIANGVGGFYRVGRRAADREVGNAVRRRNAENDWSERELSNRDRMMDKYLRGGDASDIGDSWDSIHYESKRPMRVTESELKDAIKEAATMSIIEYTQKQANTKGFKRSTHGHRNGFKKKATPEERAEARRRLGIPEPKEVEED